MIEAPPNTEVDAELLNAPAGLVGQLTFRLTDLDGNPVIAESAADITEPVPGSYKHTFVTPDVPARTSYLIVWRNPVPDPDVEVTEELVDDPQSVPDSAIPTVADVRAASNVVFAELGYPEADPDRLQGPLYEAVNEFQAATGIDPAAVSTDPADSTYDKRWPLIRKAIRQYVEYDTGASQPETLATAYDYDLIENFSVGGYSESRRNNMRSGLSVRNQYHPWPELNRTLTYIIRFGDLFGNADHEGPAVTTPALTPDPGRDFMGADLYPLGYTVGDGLYGMRVRVGGSGPPMVLS